MENIVSKIYEYLGSQRKGYAPSANYASQVGHPCERNLVYQRLNWQEKLLPEPQKLLVFREGTSHEAEVIKLLTESGITVIEQQRPFELKDIDVRGKIDGKIKLNGHAIPLEIKSVNPYDFQKINTVDDLLNSPKPWTRGYVAQMMIYLLMMEEEEGVILFKDRSSGSIKQITVKLDYEYAEKIYAKMDRVNKHIKAGTYPDRIQDRSVCQYCDFRHICLADEESEAVNITDDAELLDLIDEREALKPQAKAYEEVDAKLKEVWKSKDAGVYLVGGKYQVKITTYKSAFYSVPEDIKSKYKEEKEITKATITALK